MNADELVTAVEHAIGALSTTYKGSANESDLYEAALLTCAVAATETAGGDVVLMMNGLSYAGPIIFRTGPGNLWSPDFTYARAGFAGGAELEVHLGVKVVGASGVAHECDIAVIDAGECDRCRALGVHPRRSRVIAALEAKHYAASPGIGVGRGFLGLSQEIGGAKCFLVFPAQASSSLATMIARKYPECFPEVVPGAPAASRLTSHLEQRIRNWLS